MNRQKKYSLFFGRNKKEKKRKKNNIKQIKQQLENRKRTNMLRTDLFGNQTEGHQVHNQGTGKQRKFKDIDIFITVTNEGSPEKS